MVDYTILWQNDVVGTVTVENLSVISNDMNSILFTNEVANKPKKILSLESVSWFLMNNYGSDFIFERVEYKCENCGISYYNPTLMINGIDICEKCGEPLVIIKD